MDTYHIINTDIGVKKFIFFENMFMTSVFFYFDLWDI